MARTQRTTLARSATVRRPHLISRQTETWEALSDDSRWHYERLETPGTPWKVTDLTSITPDNPGGDSFLAPSLPIARAITANEQAVAAFLRRDERPRCAFVSTAGGCRQQCPDPPTPDHIYCTRHGGHTS